MAKIVPVGDQWQITDRKNVMYLSLNKLNKFDSTPSVHLQAKATSHFILIW